MKKQEELTNSQSCLNRAAADEWVFVLLERDCTSPAVIRFWCNKRVTAGKNQWSDAQIVEAMICADMMEAAQWKTTHTPQAFIGDTMTSGLSATYLPCEICSDYTPYACSDCAIDGHGAIHVCSKGACQRAHERTHKVDHSATFEEGV